MYFAPFVRNERNVFLENVYESIWRRELDRGEESKRSTERPDKLLLYSYQLERICLANLYYLTVVREVSAMEIGLGYYGTFRFVSCSLHLDSRTWRATTTTIKVSSLGNCWILDGPHGPPPLPPEFRVRFTAFFVGKPNKHLEFTTRAASTRWLQSASEVSTVCINRYVHTHR